MKVLLRGEDKGKVIKRKSLSAAARKTKREQASPNKQSALYLLL